MQKQGKSLYGNKLLIHLEAAFVAAQEGQPHHFWEDHPRLWEAAGLGRGWGGGFLESHCHDNAPENRGAGDTKREIHLPAFLL